MLLGDLLSGVTLETNKASYSVGERPIYRITGAPAGFIVAWTSFKDSVATGEYQANYGQVIGADGTFQVEGGAFGESDTGLWQKQVVLVSPDYDESKIQTAQTLFTVGSATEPDATSGLFSASIAGIPIWLIGAGAIGAFLIFKGR